MKTYPLKKITVVIFISLLIAPTTFLAVPQRALGFGFGGAGGGATAIVSDTSRTSLLTSAKSAITAGATISAKAATIAMEVNQYALQPLAFVLSGNLLKSMTSGILKFINGKTNGTGRPQFIQNLQGYLKGTGDTQALAFTSQFNKNSNSPYAGQISTSLRDNYLKNSTTRGFFAKNENTMAQKSSDPKDFINNSNFGAGGWGAWLSLTTNCQNDPYCLQYRAQRQQSALVRSKTTAELNKLSWGRGFLSWCGGSASTETKTTKGSSSTKDTNGSSETKTTKGSSETKDTKKNASTTKDTKAGDPCTKSDGSSGTILTPGSVIENGLHSITNANIFKSTQQGNMGPNVNTILKNTVTTLATIHVATGILGGDSNGGLTGLTQPTAGGGKSALDTYAGSAGYMGTTYSSTVKNSSSFLPTSKDMLARIKKYSAAWTTINSSANSASKTLQNLSSTCLAQKKAADTAIKNDTATAIAENTDATAVNTANTLIAETAAKFAQDANTALANDVTPVNKQASAAFEAISKAENRIQKIKSESKTGRNASTYARDVYSLTTMPPTDEDVANAQQEARSLDRASANPNGSLNVSGGSIVDRMNLFTQNTQSKLSTCTAPIAQFTQ